MPDIRDEEIAYCWTMLFMATGWIAAVASLNVVSSSLLCYQLSSRRKLTR